MMDKEKNFARNGDSQQRMRWIDSMHVFVFLMNVRCFSKQNLQFFLDSKRIHDFTLYFNETHTENMRRSPTKL